MSTRILRSTLCFILFVAGLGAYSAGDAAEKPPAPPAPVIIEKLNELFTGQALDEKRWQVTREGDFEESTVDLKDGRLRLRMSTMGTRDETVKFHGVRSTEAFDLTKGLEVNFELDWNNQANGCYMTAGVLLCPTATAGNPVQEKDWLKFEYIGVPPGKNARAFLAMRRQGNEQHLFTEGWPDKQRTGRLIGKQQVRLLIKNNTLEVWENGQLLVTKDRFTLPFTTAYLYLQMSSHSNYRVREIFYDNILVQRPAEQPVTAPADPAPAH